MQVTPYLAINQLLDELVAEVRAALGEKLVGLYLAGSLVYGDFDVDHSDIDLLAATTADIDSADFDALQKVHHALINRHPRWSDRIEILYMSLAGLKTFRSERSQIAVISPGEPFNIKDAGREWLMNWYMMREQGRTLFGPPPESIIAPISMDEFIQSVREHAQAWRGWIDGVSYRKSQAYAILTMCRTLYSLSTGKQGSKKQAAQWAAQELPEWSALINSALEWRTAQDESGVDHAATLPETRQFVEFISGRVA